MSIEITTRDLVKRYRNRTVVNHVSIQVKQGEIVGLLGPNGAGKTTTFYQVVGLIQPDEGNVFLNEVNITQLPMYKRAKMGIGYLPQEASVFRKLSVEDNISAVLEMTNLSKREQKEKLESLLNEFRLQHVRKNNGDVLSGGERRRTEIARALAVDPKFILLDEPFAGIDPIAVEDIQSIVAKLKYKNIGILITDHNVTETLSICDRAYLLIEGKIFKHGSAEELAADEQVRKLYLGRNFELKRKDYLLEESQRESANAGGDQKAFHSSENKILYSLESCMLQTDQLLRFIDNIGIFKFSMRASTAVNLSDYCMFLKEVKKSLFDFASRNDHAELLDAANNIQDIDAKEYQAMINLATLSAQSFIFIGIFLKFYLGIAHFYTIRELERRLRNVSDVLGTAHSYLKALTNNGAIS